MSTPKTPDPQDVEFSKAAADKAERADEMTQRGEDIEAAEQEEERAMERGDPPVPAKADQNRMADGTPDRSDT